jgi:hypothetical protein
LACAQFPHPSADSRPNFNCLGEMSGPEGMKVVELVLGQRIFPEGFAWVGKDSLRELRFANATADDLVEERATLLVASPGPRRIAHVRLHHSRLRPSSPKRLEIQGIKGLSWLRHSLHLNRFPDVHDASIEVNEIVHQERNAASATGGQARLPA